MRLVVFSNDSILKFLIFSPGRAVYVIFKFRVGWGLNINFSFVIPYSAIIVPPLRLIAGRGYFPRIKWPRLSVLIFKLGNFRVARGFNFLTRRVWSSRVIGAVRIEI